ncbi:MAG: glycosyltransferase family 1 protein [Crocinitomicaceae bacterium]|nr:glycosyltransferase family 1 protein [Crocinitomicaceae bacterium]
MRIAINTRFLLSHKMEGFGWYTYEIVRRLVKQHPEHEFIFFFDRPFHEKFVFGDNVTAVVLKPQARHPILFYMWFEIAVRKALKRYNVDVFFSPDGYLSLKTDVKQVNVIHDINFEHNPEDIPGRALRYLQKYFPLFAKKSDHILTVSEYSKKDICSTYQIDESKVTVAWNGASDVFKPLVETERPIIEQQYAEGKPYLLFVGALHPRKNVQRLIQAFDQMRQKDPACPYELVIVGEKMFSRGHSTIQFSDELAEHIHFTGHLSLEELARVMGAATVFTFVPYFEGFGIPLVEAMKCGTPILAGNKTSLPEVAGDAAFYCDPFDLEDITQKLIEICGNEKLRSELSTKGLERSSLFSWDKSAEVVWSVIEKIANKTVV